VGTTTPQRVEGLLELLPLTRSDDAGSHALRQRAVALVAVLALHDAPPEQRLMADEVLIIHSDAAVKASSSSPRKAAAHARPASAAKPAHTPMR
jgi:hypothetical protein